MFIKLHLWQEDQTITTLTIVDMARYPGKVGQESSKMNSPRNFVRAYSDNHSEINTTGVNYLMYVFKDMMFKGNQKAKGQPLHGNIHSKLFKEFTSLVSGGTNKISFLQFREADNSHSRNTKAGSYTKYNAFVDKQLA